ncbi:hypothetical protein [Ursidibacter sp. B-7004-1]
MYGYEIMKSFAKQYAKTGNAKKALVEVLGEERASRMKPHTLRARASELLAHWYVKERFLIERDNLIEQGVELPPRYRIRVR